MKMHEVTSDGLIFKGWVLLKLLTGIWGHKLSFFFLKKGVKHVLVSTSLKPLPCCRCTHSTMIHTN